MNARQKKFVTERLIPFILREQGRGFAMEAWGISGIKNDQREFDGMVRAIPSCGMVCCIGGSVAHLMGVEMSWTDVAEELGLPQYYAKTLMYGVNNRVRRCLEADGIKVNPWPEPFARRYARASTPLGKAKVATDLLRRVVATNGKVLGAAR